MSMIICGKDCVDCIYVSNNSDNKGHERVYCSFRNRSYYYGQSINCDDKEKHNDNED